MKWFGRIALALLAVIGLLLAIGMLLPSGFKVQRSVEIGGDARPDLPADRRSAGVEALVGLEPARPGDDDAVLGPAKRLGGALGLEERERRQRRDGVHRRRGERAASTTRSPSRTWACAPAGSCVWSRPAAGTRVTWTNEGDMGANPVNRYFGLFMDRLVGPDFEGGLKNLKALVEG